MFQSLYSCCLCDILKIVCEKDFGGLTCITFDFVICLLNVNHLSHLFLSSSEKGKDDVILLDIVCYTAHEQRQSGNQNYLRHRVAIEPSKSYS